MNRKYISILEEKEYLTVHSAITAGALDGVYNHYMNLKQERNNSNHAKTRADDRRFDTADDLKRYMQEGVDELQKLVDASKQTGFKAKQ